MSQTKDNLLDVAVGLAEERRFMECADAFGKVFEENPAHPEALRELANVMLSFGEGDAALALLADSVDFQNPDGPTLRRIANLLQGLGRDGEAADFLIGALYRDAWNADLEAETGDLLGKLGRQAEIEEFLQARSQAELSTEVPSPSVQP